MCGTVPEELSAGRWTFHRGDLRETVEKVPAGTGYLFVDADHGRRFARWYLEHLFGRIATGTPTSVHDVFHLPRARPFTEGSEVLRHLGRSGTGWFTPRGPRHRGTCVRSTPSGPSWGSPGHAGPHATR